MEANKKDKEEGISSCTWKADEKGISHKSKERENEWKNSYQERRARLRGRADHVGTWGEWDWAEEAQSALSTELWLQEGMASWISEKTGFQPWKMFCKLLLYSRLREYQGCPSLWQFNFIMSIGYKDVLKIRVHIFFCFLMSTILK